MFLIIKLKAMDIQTSFVVRGVEVFFGEVRGGLDNIFWSQCTSKAKVEQSLA